MTQAEILAIVPLGLGEQMDTASPLLSLNNAHDNESSLLSSGRMAHLVGKASMAFRIGEADALLLAFDQDADCDSPKFLWFRNRFGRFVYIDCVVVDPGRRGHGLARTLSSALFARAAGAGHRRIVCEANANRPNPASDAFDAALVFEEVGSAMLAGGAKTVR